MDSRNNFALAVGAQGARRNLNSRWLRIAVSLLMLIGLLGFSILAKNSCYLPESNPAHYISNASKMCPAHSPEFLDRTPLHLISLLIPQKATSRETHRNDPELRPINQIT